LDEITQCTLEGYTVASHFCRKEHKREGIAIYISRNILQQKLLKWATKKVIEKTFEVTGIELTFKNKKIIIIALYRSPSGGIKEFFIHLIDVFGDTNSERPIHHSGGGLEHKNPRRSK
jgi:hypothetical protein